ncbi:GH116 family glycosyl-hydrolase [Cohnella sp. GCM10020058]|uniref:GH116 family glycosyl-hydrolase n=1 Tax=Cohnella sp. GCM10020058 TaxID=3317330 RepID=UPI003644E1F0
MSQMYKGLKTREISFPLGGIGTGSIGLSGNGRLVDWEIFNRPNKRSVNGYSHFSIKAEQDGRVLDARVLNGDLQAPYVGQPRRGAALHSGYGFGPDTETMAGLPHFRDTEFEGQFPVASLSFREPSFPGAVKLLAFNPLIPLNDRDSSLPAAFFEVEIENTNARPISYTVCLSTANPQAAGQAANAGEDGALDDGRPLRLLKLSSRRRGDSDPAYGDIAIATDAPYTSCQQYWYRGEWLDHLETFWRDFTTPGEFVNRVYAEDPPAGTTRPDMASLAARIAVQPGSKTRVRFVIGWSFPNVRNFWNKEPAGTTIWKNYYASLFADAAASAAYALNHWDRLLADTLAFKDALFGSTVPEVVKEAVSANLSVLKSATTLRLTNGEFYGFEGCIEDEGSCEGSCTHVWNYAYALPFLFPQLERSMRDLDFRYNQRDSGHMNFRLMLPLGREASAFHACADGQFGGVVKAYRDWKISGDTDWLRANWDAIKKSIAYAWDEANQDRWDPARAGVLTGRQHHTLDMELYGPNAWLNGFYLAALKAGAEMARYLGEPDTAARYEQIFQKGKAWTDAHLFNGEYYVQRVDLDDCGTLEPYGAAAVDRYWNAERGEIKYQLGEGCAIDQVVAQWHANLCGLGEIFDPGQTSSALRSLYRYNFKPSLRDEANTWRLFALNDEGGLLICAWPEGSRKPYIPVPYASETMTGMEYQVASHMIQAGMVDEGLEIVRAIRNRYDGEKRNPWSEIECGSNYARSMASYSLLNAFAGFEYDLVQGMIGFHPVRREDGAFRTFWSLGSGWGTFGLLENQAELSILGGQLALRALKLPQETLRRVVGVRIGAAETAYSLDDGALRVAVPCVVKAGMPLRIALGARRAESQLSNP